jgi:uncharacterized membrane protein
MQTLFLLYVGGGVLLVLISLPLIAGKIKPNPFYGFRVKATLENRDLWYAANKYFAERLLVAGLVETLAGTGLYVWPGLSADTYALSVSGVFIVAFGVAMFQSVQYLKSLQ